MHDWQHTTIDGREYVFARDFDRDVFDDPDSMTMELDYGVVRGMRTCPTPYGQRRNLILLEDAERAAELAEEIRAREGRVNRHMVMSVFAKEAGYDGIMHVEHLYRSRPRG